MCSNCNEWNLRFSSMFKLSSNSDENTRSSISSVFFFLNLSIPSGVLFSSLRRKMFWNHVSVRVGGTTSIPFLKCKEGPRTWGRKLPSGFKCMHSPRSLDAQAKLEESQKTDLMSSETTLAQEPQSYEHGVFFHESPASSGQGQQELEGHGTHLLKPTPPSSKQGVD